MAKEQIIERIVGRPVEQLYAELGASQKLIDEIKTVSIVLAPSFLRGEINAFPVGIEEFYTYCKSKNIDIAFCADGNPPIIELCSSQIRIGTLIVSYLILPFFVNILSDYIFDKLKNTIPQETQVVEKDYQSEPTVSFTISVVDSCGIVKKDYSYEGPAKDIKEITKHVEELWNGSTDK